MTSSKAEAAAPGAGTQAVQKILGVKDGCKLFRPVEMKIFGAAHRGQAMRTTEAVILGLVSTTSGVVPRELVTRQSPKKQAEVILTLNQFVRYVNKTLLYQFVLLGHRKQLRKQLRNKPTTLYPRGRPAPGAPRFPARNTKKAAQPRAREAEKLVGDQQEVREEAVLVKDLQRTKVGQGVIS